MAEKRAFLLCFEFLCNGNLHKHLYDDTACFDWDKRYKIIRGVCRGLHYLHDKHRIVHRDLKPQNILMDDKMMPKIGDFNLSKILGQGKSRIFTANFAGTPGYMAPECIDQLCISFEADIFNLGIIIFEIIRGHKDYPRTSERTETFLKHYKDEVVESWRNRTPRHMSPEMHIQQVEKCISIALMCLQQESKKRPTSLHIVQDLDALEPESRYPEEDRRNQNLQSQANVNIINIPKTMSATNGLNECANLFQWVSSAISSPKPQWNETQKEKFHADVRQLQRDLQCLSDTLPAMYKLIDQAEWRIHEHYVAELLSRLKDAVYDAEDIVDEFRWYEIKLSVEGSAISVEPIIDFFHSVTEGSSNKVDDIQKRLNHLSGQLEKMGLFQATVPRFDRSFRPETTSFPTEGKIFGRDEEKKKLIRLLGVPTNNTIDSNETTVTNVPVLPIVGIGGVGKTTLAQDICNHSKVKHHFHLIIWICVSDDFDVRRLTKEALEQSCGKVPINDNLNFLQSALAKSLNTKRFLIVLDDMWHEKELDWKRFYAPFRNVLQGSMMLVTTRSPNVANIVCTEDLRPFPLEGIKEIAFRKFFKECVFGSNSSNNRPELEQIGEKILPRLKGSPLAAKTLGRLLGMSLEVAHWNWILESQLWEHRQKETEILPALRLSYMYLPLYLKRCFSFCAVYPKDYNFKKKDLAEIWVAEGLAEDQHTGDLYFEELAHLAFFQKCPWSEEKYVIHDLMHDKAQKVSEDECFIVKDTKDMSKIPQNVRHLSVLIGAYVQCSDLLNLCKHTKLRTLLCDMFLGSETVHVMEKWCTELLCMRVMVCSVSKWGLPGSIGNMKLLRYLNILDSSPCKRLPPTFCCLYNMQIFYAKKWDIVNIPCSFVKLINLQKFESKKYRVHHIDSSDIHQGAADKDQRRQFELRNYNGEYLPCGFHAQNLANITSLLVFYCDNVKSISFSMNSEQFHNYNSNDSTFSSLTYVQITKCQKLSSLEQFLHPGYVAFIKKIEISYCPSLESLPTDRFGDLRFLEVLRVSQCPQIKSRCLFAPSLKELYLHYSGNLGYNIECGSLIILYLSGYSLESNELQMYLPLLQELNITSCFHPKIIRYSEPVYTDLSLGGARSRKENFRLLTHLAIKYCYKLETIDDLIYLPTSCGLLSLPANRPHLKHLNISNCPSLKWQSGMLLPSSLQNLTLQNCGDFSASFPSCLENLSSLESLEIIGCECIVSVPGHLWSSNLKSLQRLKFHYRRNLKSIGGPDAIAHIRDLCIQDCEELKEIDQPLRKGSFL